MRVCHPERVFGPAEVDVRAERQGKHIARFIREFGPVWNERDLRTESSRGAAIADEDDGIPSTVRRRNPRLLCVPTETGRGARSRGNAEKSRRLHESE